MDLIDRQAAIDASTTKVTTQELKQELKNSTDAIDRQAAIDALMEKDKKLRNINWYDKPYAEGECRGIDEALSIISNLPSVQPQRKTDEWCADCKEYDQERHCCPRWNRVIRETLKDAQPETHEKRTETHACDCISRQAAIDALVNHSYPVRYDFGFTSIENGMTVTGIRQALSELPTIEERKKGEWTDDNACPFCRFQPWYERDIHTLSFCPNCGADMRGEDDG